MYIYINTSDKYMYIIYIIYTYTNAYDTYT